MQPAKPGITITWDENVKCIQAIGQGFVDGNSYRGSMDKGLELLKEKKASRWLADMLDQKVLSSEDQDWTIQDWTPRAVAAGIKKSAFVVPKSVIAQMSLRRMTAKVGNVELEMAYFESVEEAKKWLKAL